MIEERMSREEAKEILKQSPLAERDWALGKEEKKELENIAATALMIGFKTDPCEAWKSAAALFLIDAD
jgi:hypothetical protein